MDSKPAKLIPSKVIGYSLPPDTVTLSPIIPIVYSLSLGFNANPLDSSHYKFTYELNENFTVFPTMLATIALNSTTDVLGSCPGMPDFNLMGLLHGEQYTEFTSPLPIGEPIEFTREI